MAKLINHQRKQRRATREDGEHVPARAAAGGGRHRNNNIIRRLGIALQASKIGEALLAEIWRSIGMAISSKALSKESNSIMQHENSAASSLSKAAESGSEEAAPAYTASGLAKPRRSAGGARGKKQRL